MKIPNITGLVKVGKTFIQANRPEILFGASVIGTLATGFFAAKGGYEAGQKVLQAEFSDLDLTSEEGKATPLTSKEKIQLTWLCYMPAAIACVGAVGSTTGLHIVHVKDKKMMAQTALAALEEVKTSAKEYAKDVEDAIKENATPKTAEKIENDIEDRQAIRAASSDDVVEDLYLVRDGLTGRDIWSNQHRIESAIIEVNNVLNGSGDVELNHFYRHAGFNNIPDGFNQGWSGSHVSLEWKETKRDDGRPVREFFFLPVPEKGYDSPNR